MALVTGEELALNLDQDWDDVDQVAYDQVAEAASDMVGSMITTAAYEEEPASVREAAMNVAVDMYQARTAAGGQSVSIDFQPGPYRISSFMLRRISALIAKYVNVGSMVG